MPPPLPETPNRQVYKTLVGAFDSPSPEKAAPTGAPGTLKYTAHHQPPITERHEFEVMAAYMAKMVADPDKFATRVHEHHEKLKVANHPQKADSVKVQCFHLALDATLDPCLLYAGTNMPRTVTKETGLHKGQTLFTGDWNRTNTVPPFGTGTPMDIYGKITHHTCKWEELIKAKKPDETKLLAATSKNEVTAPRVIPVVGSMVKDLYEGLYDQAWTIRDVAHYFQRQLKKWDQDIKIKLHGHFNETKTMLKNSLKLMATAKSAEEDLNTGESLGNVNLDCPEGAVPRELQQWMVTHVTQVLDYDGTAALENLQNEQNAERPTPNPGNVRFDENPEQSTGATVRDEPTMPSQGGSSRERAQSRQTGSTVRDEPKTPSQGGSRHERAQGRQITPPERPDRESASDKGSFSEAESSEGEPPRKRARTKKKHKKRAKRKKARHKRHYSDSSSDDSTSSDEDTHVGKSSSKEAVLMSMCHTTSPKGISAPLVEYFNGKKNERADTLRTQQQKLIEDHKCFRKFEFGDQWKKDLDNLKLHSGQGSPDWKTGIMGACLRQTSAMVCLEKKFQQQRDDPQVQLTMADIQNHPKGELAPIMHKV